MGRTAGSNGQRTAAAIRRVGLRLIYRRDFEAMSLRDLAAEVGIQAASLYHHIRTKQDLLFDLVREHMENLLAQTDAALEKAPTSGSLASGCGIPLGGDCVAIAVAGYGRPSHREGGHRRVAVAVASGVCRSRGRAWVAGSRPAPSAGTKSRSPPGFADAGRRARAA